MSSDFRPRAAVSARRSLLLAAALLGVASDALAHGFAGSRFFPATLSTDDPFVADELSLPTVTKHPNSGDTPALHETDIGVDVAKPILPNWGVEVGQSWMHPRARAAALLPRRPVPRHPAGWTAVRELRPC